VIEGDDLSSVSSKNTETLIKKMKTYDEFTVTISSEDALKVLNVHNVQTVRKRGVKYLKMDASIDEFNAVGEFAQNALEDIESQNNLSLSLVSASAQINDQIITGVIYNTTKTPRTLTFLYSGQEGQTDPRNFGFKIGNDNGGNTIRFFNDNVDFTRLFGGIWQIQINDPFLDFTSSRSASISVWTTKKRPGDILDVDAFIGEVKRLQVTIV
jgi:hypothetical protein